MLNLRAGFIAFVISCWVICLYLIFATFVCSYCVLSKNQSDVIIAIGLFGEIAFLGTCVCLCIDD